MDWKGLLKLNQDEVLGLDIGSSTVKMVQLRKDNGDCSVTAAAIVDITDGQESDKNREQKNTIKAIRDCFRSVGIRTRFAVCGVCGPEVAVRYFEFPFLPAEEIEGAVMLEASQVCPFNVDDGAVDYQLITDGDDKVSGILVAATGRLIKEKTRLAKDASLDNVLMDVDGLALLNCFSECEKDSSGRTKAVLNVGRSFTNLAIIGDNSLPFIRDISYAGKAIIDEIAGENDVSAEVVERILAGCEDADQPQLELGSSLRKACRKLIVDITETLRYYAAQKNSSPVTEIFVCGGFALVEGFLELLNDKLPAPAVLWNPFDKMQCDADQSCRDVLEKRGPAMAVAAGLAMRSI